MISIFNSVENIVGKGGNAGYQHFFLSNSVFKSTLPSALSQNCVVKAYIGGYLTFSKLKHSSLFHETKTKL